jgi:hypothetical protein
VRFDRTPECGLAVLLLGRGILHEIGERIAIADPLLADFPAHRIPGVEG